jgi:predicted ABC-type transport system involved in lysophospholipase L1 biosynthesis ATPase subunit
MIRVLDVCKSVAGSGAVVEILRGVSLEVQRAEVVGLLGPSGAGKTTLLNLVAGVDVPSSGEIMVDGRRLADLNRHDLAVFRRETIGMVFQNFHLLPNLTAEENVALPLHLRGMPRREAQRCARRRLEQVGLTHRTHHFPEQLSGGERQRVAIGRALAADPPVLLADEPTGSLDSETGSEILELLVGLQRELGTTMIVVTHDAEVARWCHRIVRMRDGRLT